MFLVDNALRGGVLGDGIRGGGRGVLGDGIRGDGRGVLGDGIRGDGGGDILISGSGGVILISGSGGVLLVSGSGGVLGDGIRGGGRGVLGDGIRGGGRGVLGDGIRGGGIRGGGRGVLGDGIRGDGGLDSSKNNATAVANGTATNTFLLSSTHFLNLLQRDNGCIFFATAMVLILGCSVFLIVMVEGGWDNIFVLTTGGTTTPPPPTSESIIGVGADERFGTGDILFLLLLDFRFLRLLRRLPPSSGHRKILSMVT